MEKSATSGTCPATKTLTLLSKRHMLMLMHTLVSGPAGFNDLQKTLEINTATLANRLRELETERIIEKVSCPTDSRCHYYTLTKRGKKMSTLIEKFSMV